MNKELYFGDRFTADYYMSALQDMVDKNGFVTLKSIYDMAACKYDESSNDYLETYGYFCLDGFRVKRIKTSQSCNYKVQLPEPIKLTLLNYKEKQK